MRFLILTDEPVKWTGLLSSHSDNIEVVCTSVQQIFDRCATLLGFSDGADLMCSHGSLFFDVMNGWSAGFARQHIRRVFGRQSSVGIL